MEYNDYSPGPWINCGSHIDNANGLPILRAFHGFDRFNPYDIRLAAAAPELVEEARWVCKLFGTEHPKGIEELKQHIQRLREIVKKATAS